MLLKLSLGEVFLPLEKGRALAGAGAGAGAGLVLVVWLCLKGDLKLGLLGRS